MPTIVPVAAPQAVTTANTTSSNDSARARAIAMLSGGTPQASQVDQNRVTAETLKAASPTQETASRASNDTSNAGQNDTDEVTTEVPSKSEEPISSQYAVLARKEKALRAKAVQQEQTFKAREAALAAREAEISSQAAPDLSNYIQKDKLKQNPYQALTDAGVSYDDYVQQVLANQTPEAQALNQVREEMRQELQKIRDEQDNNKKSQEHQQSQAYQQALNQIRLETVQLVKTDPNYETIKATSSVNDVVELIERTFKEDGVLMTVQEAADAVEEHLVEEALKYSRLGKVQQRLKKADQFRSGTAPTQQQANGATQQLKTLTNNVGSTRPLNARERALLAFRGELK